MAGQPTAPSTGPLSYAQLKGVWLAAAKGTKYESNHWASLMAAIAEAESGGDPLATNPNDNNGTQTSWGLWQISNGTHSAPATNWGDPAENARLAIQKLNTQGLSAWGTYTSGAYKGFLSGKTSAAPSAVGQAQATAAAEGQKSCVWSIGWGGIPGTSWLSFLGIGPPGGGNVGSGEVCLLGKSQARALIGVGLLGAGLVIGFIGVNWVIIAAASAELSKLIKPIVGAVVPTPAKVGASVAASSAAA